MFTQRKILVGVVSLFAFLATSAGSATAILAEDDMHWKVSPTSVTSEAPQLLAACESPDCDDDMHW